MAEQILGLSVVAKLLSVNKETVRRWVISKYIPAHKIHPKGHWRFYRSDIDKFLQARQSELAPGQVRSAN